MEWSRSLSAFEFLLPVQSETYITNTKYIHKSSINMNKKRASGFWATRWIEQKQQMSD